jgi:hypothetical protein
MATEGDTAIAPSTTTKGVAPEVTPELITDAPIPEGASTEAPTSERATTTPTDWHCHSGDVATTGSMELTATEGATTAAVPSTTEGATTVAVPSTSEEASTPKTPISEGATTSAHASSLESMATEGVTTASVPTDSLKPMATEGASAPVTPIPEGVTTASLTGSEGTPAAKAPSEALVQAAKLWKPSDVEDPPNALRQTEGDTAVVCPVPLNNRPYGLVSVDWKTRFRSLQLLRSKGIATPRAKSAIKGLHNTLRRYPARFYHGRAVQFGHTAVLALKGYTGSNFTGCKTTACSTYGYPLTVAYSALKDELTGLVEGNKEALWTKGLYSDIQCPIRGPTPLNTEAKAPTVPHSAETTASPTGFRGGTALIAIEGVLKYSYKCPVSTALQCCRCAVLQWRQPLQRLCRGTTGAVASGGTGHHCGTSGSGTH